jgi:hypothetical protein
MMIYYITIDSKTWVRHTDSEIDKFYILAQTDVCPPKNCYFTTT